jgi:hypothetical protein
MRKKSYEHTGRGTAQRYAMIEELSVQFPIKESCVESGKDSGLCRIQHKPDHVGLWIMSDQFSE